MYADQLLNSHACEFLWVDSEYTLCTKSLVQCLKVMCKVSSLVEVSRNELSHID